MSGLAEAFGYFIWEKDVFPDVEVYMQAIPSVPELTMLLLHDTNSSYSRDIIWYQNHVK